jgi:hypothetical protein
MRRIGLAATIVVLLGSSAFATPFGRGGAPGPRTGGTAVRSPAGVVRTAPGVGVGRVPYAPGVRYSSPVVTRPFYASPYRRYYYPRYRYYYPYYYPYFFWRPYYGSYYGYYPGYSYYYDYGYYPAAAPAAAAPAPAYGPTTVAAVREPQPTFGLGLNLSGKRIDGLPDGTGIGIVGRFHSPSSLDFELEVAQDKFAQGGRADTRAGAGVYIPLFGEQFQPYLVVGAGVNFIHTDGSTGISDVHQGYLAGGGGLALRFGHLSIGGDVRFNVRELLDHKDSPLQTTDALFPQNKEQGWEGRVTGVFYF